MPFAKFKNFAECVRANQGKKNPEGYCAAIHYKATGRWPAESTANAIRQSAPSRNKSEKGKAK